MKIEEEKIERNIKWFDYDQYKKDMNELNRLTKNILENNPLYIKYCWKKTEEELINESIDDLTRLTGLYFDKEKIKQDALKRKNLKNSENVNYINGMDRIINYFNDRKKNCTNMNSLVDGLLEEVKEANDGKNDVFLPYIAKDLKDLGLYLVYAIENNKFNADWIDFITEKDENGEDVIESKLFNFAGKIREKYIPLDSNIRIDIRIKDFINNEFIKNIKYLSNKNIDEVSKNLKNPLIIKNETDKDTLKEICNKVVRISNFIFNRNRRGSANFIFASKKNIELILNSFSGYWSNQGKTFKYNMRITNQNYSFVANEDLGNDVIIGRCQNEGEPGINLVINKNTLSNYQYTEDDISGINLEFDFFVLGKNPEYNYFSFEMKN